MSDTTDQPVNENVPVKAARKPRVQSSWMPVTEERKQKFLAALRESGSLRDAAAAASPLATPGEGNHAISTFRLLMRTDPAFAQAVAEAREYAIGKLEKECARRAFVSDKRPVVDRNGTVVAVAESWQAANNLMLNLLAKLDPESWTPSQKKTIDTTVKHVNGGPSGSALTIPFQDLQLLDDTERDQLSTILRSLMEKKELAERQKQVEQQPQQALPAPSEGT